jgi:hypothetical protein
MKFLTCEPYLGENLDKRHEYIDEADQFFENPQQWYAANQKELEGITYLVMFENLHKQILNMKEDNQNSIKKAKTIRDFLLDHLKCESFFNSIVQPTERTDKFILVCNKGL